MLVPIFIIGSVLAIISFYFCEWLYTKFGKKKVSDVFSIREMTSNSGTKTYILYRKIREEHSFSWKWKLVRPCSEVDYNSHSREIDLSPYRIEDITEGVLDLVNKFYPSVISFKTYEFAEIYAKKMVETEKSLKIDEENIKSFKKTNEKIIKL